MVQGKESVGAVSLSDELVNPYCNWEELRSERQSLIVRALPLTCTGLSITLLPELDVGAQAGRINKKVNQ